MKILKRFLILALFIPAVSYGEEDQMHIKENKQSGIGSLSIELRNLLSEEMRQLQSGMTEIIPLYISGQWDAIAPIASKMEKSYVLKQALTEDQVHELHAKLPPGFVELDQEFHYLSGMLEHAAKMAKPELIGFYYSKMGETCVSCHRQYAKEKFPQFATVKDDHTH